MKTSTLKHIPTKQLKTILNDPYTRGVDGKDYQEAKDELARILWEREDKRLQIELKEREKQESLYLNSPDRIKPFLDNPGQSEQLPKLPHPDDMECLAIYGHNRPEFYADEKGNLTEIPGVILPF